MGLFEPANRWETVDVEARDAAVQQAIQWVAENPQVRYYATVAPTGSMKGDLDENSIICLERDKGGSQVVKGDLVSYHASDKWPRVLHKVSALNERAFIGNGTACKRYDGWKSRNAIHSVARKVIRFPAQKTPTK